MDYQRAITELARIFEEDNSVYYDIFSTLDNLEYDKFNGYLSFRDYYVYSVYSRLYQLMETVFYDGYRYEYDIPLNMRIVYTTLPNLDLPEQLARWSVEFVNDDMDYNSDQYAMIMEISSHIIKSFTLSLNKCEDILLLLGQGVKVYV